MTDRRNIALFAALLILTAGFAIGVPGFWDTLNLLDNTRYWLPLVGAAVVMTPIIISGGIDLSIGSLTALVGVVMGVLWRYAGWPLPAALAAGLATGLAGGLLNALLIAKGRIPPLVVTLATLASFRGLTTGISRGHVVRGFPDWFGALGRGSLLGITTQVWLIFFIVAMAAVFLHFTRWGRMCYAVGDNERAARFAGLPVNSLKLILYCASGLMAALIAVVDVSHFDAADPQRGMLLELNAITIVVLGGTRITGGAGSTTGTVLAALIVCVLTYGARMIPVPDSALIGLLGAVLVVTASLNEWLARGGLYRASPQRSENGQ